jgi:hypothetical protein
MPRPFIVAAVALAIVTLAPGATLAQVGTPTPDFLSPEAISPVFVALVRDGDRYLVDSEVALPSTAATPTP